MRLRDCINLLWIFLLNFLYFVISELFYEIKGLHQFIMYEVHKIQKENP